MRLIVLLLVIVLVLTGCVPQGMDVKELKSVEVREYEGKRLDSITSFRDNSIAGTQYVNVSEYVLSVEGLVDNPKNYTYNEVIDRQLYKKIVRLNCVEGWSRDILWEGILLKDLFEEVGVQENATIAIFYAEDGYSSSLPINYLIENNIILAHKQNDVVLPASNGFPFQVVAEDKYGIKWVKWVTKIVISNNDDFEGFWESRGYNNEADVGGPIFE